MPSSERPGAGRRRPPPPLRQRACRRSGQTTSIQPAQTDPRRIVATGEHGETESALRRVRRTHITRENLRRAITRLVNDTFAARDPALWGTGTACAGDSKRFGSWQSNLMTEYHARYGGPGVMIYWHVERKSTCTTAS